MARDVAVRRAGCQFLAPPLDGDEPSPLMGEGWVGVNVNEACCFSGGATPPLTPPHQGEGDRSHRPLLTMSATSAPAPVGVTIR
jgi:hypothetical protein